MRYKVMILYNYIVTIRML